MVGVATRLHLVPFQCQISEPWRLRVSIAQAFAADVAATPLIRPAARRGSAERFHAVPFQCRISGPPAAM